jgi:hypothetical protein
MILKKREHVLDILPPMIMLPTHFSPVRLADLDEPVAAAAVLAFVIRFLGGVGL